MDETPRVRLLTLACMLVGASASYSQVVLDPYTTSVGPVYGYTAQGSREAFNSIAGKPATLYYPFGGGLAQPEDDGYASLNLPFNFRFFGNIVPAGNPIFASANGFLLFGTSSATVVPTNLLNEPASFGNQPAISPLFSDLVARGMQQGGPGLYVQEQGTPGSRQLTIEWSSIQHFNGLVPTQAISFQVCLFEVDGKIVFNYGSTLFGTSADQGNMATIGIRDTTFSDPPDNVLQWGYHDGTINSEGILLGSSDFRITFNAAAAAVPEPTSIAMAALGGTGLLGSIWYRRRKPRTKVAKRK